MYFRFLILIMLILGLFFLPGCRGCSRSGRESLYSHEKHDREERNERGEKDINRDRHENSSGNIISMRHANGLYFIPLKVNGLDMEFIFDTGASIISISLTEARLLHRSGKLHKDDIIGSSFFLDATGTISEGTWLNLREVEIGNQILYNVEASVVHNLKAPLLLGQSALNRFGKITIDYDNNKLILE